MALEGFLKAFDYQVHNHQTRWIGMCQIWWPKSLRQKRNVTDKVAETIAFEPFGDLVDLPRLVKDASRSHRRATSSAQTIVFVAFRGL